MLDILSKFAEKALKAEPSSRGRKFCQHCHLLFIGEVATCPTDGSVLVAASVADDEANLVPGYRLLREVGIGATAKVFKAVRLADQSEFAIKILHPWLLEDFDTVCRFSNEAEISSRLSSCHTVSVEESGRLADGRPFMVMEYIEGFDISTVLEKQEPMAPSWAVPVFMQLASGLAHCHDQGIVHKDIKPANVLLAEMGGKIVVKIVDFGIAQQTLAGNVVSLLRAGETVGSPMYMSPEQCMGRVVDQRSDIYSMGCLMYEILTGQPVFFAEDAVTLMKKHVYQEAAPFVLLPTRQVILLEKIVFKAMAKNPFDRYQNVHAMLKDLWASMSEHPPLTLLSDEAESQAA